MVNFYRDVYCLLGLPFDAVDMEGAVQRVRDAATHHTSCFISTPNLNFPTGCREDSPFRKSSILCNGRDRRHTFDHARGYDDGAGNIAFHSAA